MTAPSFDEFRFVSGSVSRETFERLIAFDALFRRWAARINLVAPSTLPISGPPYPRQRPAGANQAGGAASWLDLGSGGGFPGAVMAFLLKERPGASIDLVESNRKKAASCRPSWPVRCAGAGACQTHRGCLCDCSQPEIVTARALAPLRHSARAGRALADRRRHAALPQRPGIPSEIRESADAWQYRSGRTQEPDRPRQRHSRGDQSRPALKRRRRTKSVTKRFTPC